MPQDLLSYWHVDVCLVNISLSNWFAEWLDQIRIKHSELSYKEKLVQVNRTVLVFGAHIITKIHANIG